MILHPVLGTVLPEPSRKVQPAFRDWAWEANARRRLALVSLVLRVKGIVCHLCGLTGATTADHLIPWAHGGRNELDNLAPAHSGCNSSRRDLPLVEWFQRHPVRVPSLAPSREWSK